MFCVITKLTSVSLIKVDFTFWRVLIVDVCNFCSEICHQRSDLHLYGETRTALRLRGKKKQTSYNTTYGIEQLISKRLHDQKTPLYTLIKGQINRRSSDMLNCLRSSFKQDINKTKLQTQKVIQRVLKPKHRSIIFQQYSINGKNRNVDLLWCCKSSQNIPPNFYCHCKTCVWHKKKRNPSTVTKLQSNMLQDSCCWCFDWSFFVTSVHEKWLQFSFLEPTKYFSYNCTPVGVHDTQHHFWNLLKRKKWEKEKVRKVK